MKYLILFLLLFLTNCWIQKENNTQQNKIGEDINKVQNSEKKDETKELFLILKKKIITNEDILKVKTLIKNWVNVNSSRNEWNLSPLIVAINSRNYELLDVLISSGADVNARFWYYTPLMIAIPLKDPKLIELLVSKWADVNAFGWQGSWSVLMLTIGLNDYEITKILIEAWANINYCNEKECISDIAKKTGNKKIIDLLKQKDKNFFTKILLK